MRWAVCLPMVHLRITPQWTALGLLGLLAVLGTSGCRALVDRPAARLAGPQTPPPMGESVPTEKDKSTLAPYTIEPPDILLIEAVRLVPKAPYLLQSTDVLTIEIDTGPAVEPSRAQYLIDSKGRVDLGARYGKVAVAGLDIDVASEKIQAIVAEIYKEPQVSVSLAQSSALQPITGEHLVSPDGTVNLGTYGQVYVAAMTLEEAREAVEAQLAKFLDHPQVALSVFAYNSKVYYVITQGAGSGDQLARLPITGNETVLDAISQINGLSRLSSKTIWIARPAPGGVGCDTVLPVNWNEITAGAATATNYQVLPGDRVFIAENKMIALDAALNKAIAPVERVFGFSLLGAQSVQTINRFPLGLSGLGGGF